MAVKLTKFKDSEFGDSIIQFTYDEKKYDFVDTMNLAMKVLYLDYGYSTYEDLKYDYEELTEELYNICMDVLDGGGNGVIISRFCGFMKKAFGWDYEIVDTIYVVDIENGDWY